MNYRRQPSSKLERLVDDKAAGQRVALSDSVHKVRTILRYVIANFLPCNCGHISILSCK